MTGERSLLIGRYVCVAFCLFVLTPEWVSGAVNCKALNDLATESGVFIPGDDSGRIVVGSGRLPFYSAPDYRCKMNGVFVIEGQAVDAYTEYGRFTLITYRSEKKGEPAMGWVRSNRLKPNGLGIAPAQK